MEASYFAGAILILLFSVIIHEVMHGLAALYFGDHTAEAAGRLTLNPLPHIDPIGTILIPALFLLPSLLGSSSGFIVGWAKPVPVNPFNFSNIRKGELFTSLAGVLANFTIAIIAALAYHLLLSLQPTTNYLLLILLLQFTVTINLILGVFNSLPIPPLDGSKVLISFLPTHLAVEFEKLERFGFFIIIFLWFFPVGGVPILTLIVSNLIRFFNLFLQVPLRLF